MSEETKQATNEWKLPTPVLPDLAMPENPKTGRPEEITPVSCEGDMKQPMPDNSAIPDPTPGVPRILIGMPILTFSMEFVQTFLKFWTELCTMEKGKLQAGYFFAYRKPVNIAEIQIVETAIFNKCTHVLFIDDDIYDYKASDLLKLLEADKDVISGVMYASKFPYAMCVFRRFNTGMKVIDMPSDNSMFRLYEIPCICQKCGLGMSHWDAKFCPSCGQTQDNLIQKADLIPFCFTLMKLDIFKKMKKPWFHCTDIYPSDSWFADRCTEAGVQEWAHMAVRLTHAGINDATRNFYMQMNLEEKKRNQSAGVIPLSQEDMDKHQYILNSKMIEAENKLKIQDAPKLVTIGAQQEESNDSKTQSITDVVPEQESAQVPS